MRRYAIEAPPLALRAVQAALAQAQLPAERITHLVTVSCSGFHAPGVDLALMAALPLDAGLARTHVGFMGCHGALNGLRVAAGVTGSQLAKCSNSPPIVPTRASSKLDAMNNWLVKNSGSLPSLSSTS